jgi:membrane-bound serine protease (ClpP class)
MLKNRILAMFVVVMLLLSMTPTINALAQSDGAVVVVVTLEGPLTPVWSGYLQRGINQAITLNADLLVIQLNTPGGSIDIMNQLVQQILASPIPVAVFVSPRGSMAASAGTLLVLAGQIGAMTPESAIWAASPVGLQGENIGTTEEVKTKEILKASVRSMALRRGSAAVSLAEQAIDSAKAASSKEALDAGLIDFVATDIPDLLRQIDGKIVQVNNAAVTVIVNNARLVSVPASMLENILGLLTNPNIVFLLLSIGVQALLIELSSPGGWVAGFFGVVLLALAIYGLGILPVNWFGIVFLILAFVLFILDIKAPTHGALTIAGTASFITGGLVLFNSARIPGFPNVSVPLVVGMGVFIGATFFAVVMIALRAMKTPVSTGRELLIGKTGFAVSAIDPKGIVQVAGERWSALLYPGTSSIQEKEQVVVVRVEGLKLVVKKG